jgi:hypothetical protein
MADLPAFFVEGGLARIAGAPSCRHKRAASEQFLVDALPCALNDRLLRLLRNVRPQGTQA